MYYDNSGSNWKLNLLKHRSVINEFFESENILDFDFSSFNSIIQDSKLHFFQNDLVKTEILNHICPACTFHWWNYGGYYSLYPYNTKTQSKIYVLADERNDILRALENDNIINVDDWQRIESVPFYRGWEIFFTCKLNNKKYQWWGKLKEKTDLGEWKDIEGVDLSNLREELQKQS